MRTITTDTIIQNIKEMCIEANYSLTSDVKDKLYQAAEEENSPLGRQMMKYRFVRTQVWQLYF